MLYSEVGTYNVVIINVHPDRNTISLVKVGTHNVHVEALDFTGFSCQ